MSVLSNGMPTSGMIYIYDRRTYSFLFSLVLCFYLPPLCCNVVYYKVFWPMVFLLTSHFRRHPIVPIILRQLSSILVELESDLFAHVMDPSRCQLWDLCYSQV